MPFRQFDRHILRAVKKNQLAGMEVHNLVARLVTMSLHRTHHSLDIINGEADVIQTHLVEVANVRIIDDRRISVVQQLDFSSGRDTRCHQS